jgi:PAT family beta-lactamase induction signal transducer AmpG
VARTPPWLDVRDARRAGGLDRRTGPVLAPQADIWTIAYLASAVAFFSASLDIALDAFRREILPNPELGLGNAIHVNAYRISSLVPGSLALILADRMPWSQVFFITALFMLPGLVMTLMVREPTATAAAPKTLRDAVVLPFREFIDRSGWSHALLILAFIFLYKLGTAWPRRSPRRSISTWASP